MEFEEKYAAGLDFWTTNSTIWFNDWSKHWLIGLWNWRPETRTALFYDSYEREYIIWDEWILAFMEWSSWRLLQSLKSFLSTKEEVSTILWWKQMKLTEMIALIIKDYKRRLEEVIWSEVDNVLIWRPVKFSTKSPELDKLAQDRLEKSAKIAWFKNVAFEYEPIAAVYSFRERLGEILKNKNILIADLWWWTSDFSLVNIWEEHINVLWSNWVYIWWNNFDQRLSIKYFADFFWKWWEYNCFWKEWASIPNSLYFLLSDWKHLHELSDKKNLSLIEQIYNHANDKESFWRLKEIAENNHLWFEYFKMIETAKKYLSINSQFNWKTSYLEDQFEYLITRELFNQINSENVEKLKETIDELMLQSWLKQDNIDMVVLTWWTSLIPVVRTMLEQLIWSWKILKWETFTGVWEWLVIKSINSF